MKLFVDYSNQKLDKWLRMFELLIYQSEYVIENFYNIISPLARLLDWFEL